MYNFKLIFYVIFFLNAYNIKADDSSLNKRLCANEDCTEPISIAKTVQGSPSFDNNILAFQPNVEVKIFSKPLIKPETGLWEGEINGKRGFVPSNLLREQKKIKKPTFEVEIKPDVVQSNYEVVDGTTIINEVNDVETNIGNPVEVTATPDLNVTGEENVQLETTNSKEDDDDDDDYEDEDDDDDIDVDSEIEDDEGEEAETAPIQSSVESKIVNADKEIEIKKDVNDDNAEIKEEEKTNQNEQKSEDSYNPNEKETEEAVKLEMIPSGSIISPIKAKLHDAEGNFKSTEEIKENDEVTTELPISSLTEETYTTVSVQINQEIPTQEPVTEISVENVEETTEFPITEAVTEQPDIVETVTPPQQEPIIKTEDKNVLLKDEKENIVEVAQQENIVLETEVKENNVKVEEKTVLVTEENDNTEKSEEQDIKTETVSLIEEKESEEGINKETENVVVEELNEPVIKDAESSGIVSEFFNSMFGNSETPQNTILEEEKRELNVEETRDETTKLSEESVEEKENNKIVSENVEENSFVGVISKQDNEDVEFCNADSTNCENDSNFLKMEITYDLISVIAITAVTIVTFLLGRIFIDKSRKEAPLIAKINKLEKDLLIALKENELLTEKAPIVEAADDAIIINETIEKLTYELALANNAKISLEEQIENLEKELENSTEVALELNRMLSDVLSSQNGSDTLIANVEQLQRQLIEQQDTINNVNESLSEKNTENHELRLELEISNKKVTELQVELDKMVLNLLKIEEEKDQQQNALESEIVNLKRELDRLVEQSGKEVVHLRNQMQSLQSKLNETQRNLDVKISEFKLLEEGVKAANNNSESLLELSSVKAELLQLKKENQLLTEHLRQEQESKAVLEKQIQSVMQDIESLKKKYEEADKEKVEAQTKLQVLSVYFKEKEAQLQKELNKHEEMWNEQKGEANSTIERIKYMQEELQNYKAQNESLKQEIVAQEVELKSQISILEKKAHENWVNARQAERRLEDAKQEAAQLRNRLTMRERTINEEKGQNRIQSPLEQNGDMHLSSVDTPASPPLLFGSRDHMTTSPPLPGLPPPFMPPPPPPGVPFMPPPLPPGVPPPPFIPPPPTLYPVDHRPPPLGRMSSPPPPLNSRYAPDTRAFSPYDRNSPSPPYDSEYGPPSPPPPHRGYSPYNGRGDDRRDYKRAPPIRNTNRHNKGSASSGNSNESLEKINRHHNKV